jgi:hypothetical protein
MKLKIKASRKRQVLGTLIGVIAGVLLLLFLSTEANEEYKSLGPMNTGHDGFSCNTCHSDAAGNLWQQAQSNLQHSIGLRENSVAFGSLDVETKKCLACHERDNDRHPTHRFLETKYKEAVAKINTTSCITCHAEHNAKRLTLSKVDYCMHCHEDLTVKNDPIDISHETLIAAEKWDTCLQCHDFHGNHEYKTPKLMKDTLSYETLEVYFDGGKDPYSRKKKFTALSEKEWIEKFLK